MEKLHGTMLGKCVCPTGFNVVIHDSVPGVIAYIKRDHDYRDRVVYGVRVDNRTKEIATCYQDDNVIFGEKTLTYHWGWQPHENTNYDWQYMSKCYRYWCVDYSSYGELVDYINRNFDRIREVYMRNTGKVIV